MKSYGCKKPSLKGVKNTGYLGHFAKDKFLAQGHNDSGGGYTTMNPEARIQTVDPYDPSWDRMREIHKKKALGRPISQSDKEFLESRSYDSVDAHKNFKSE